MMDLLIDVNEEMILAEEKMMEEISPDRLLSYAQEAAKDMRNDKEEQS